MDPLVVGSNELNRSLLGRKIEKKVCNGVGLLYFYLIIISST